MNPLPRGLRTSKTRISRCPLRSVDRRRIASATANSADPALSVLSYSPTQNDVAGNAERRAAGAGGPRGEEGRRVVEEPAEVLVLLRVWMERLEAVDDDHARAALHEDPADPVEDSGQALVVQGPAEILVDDRGSDGPPIEEVQCLAVPQDLVERLGDGGQVHRRPFLR